MKKARIVLKLDDSGFYILSRQFLDFFVFWKVCVEFAFPRVAMGLLDFVNHIEEDQHICRQGSKADNEVNGRIVGGIHCIFAHVLEGREGLCEHAPEGQSMGSVLQPCAFAYCECADGRRQEQGKTAVPCVVRQAVVCIGEVPKVISDNPEPQHIR